MSAHSILHGPLSYLQVCVIATSVLRRAIKPSVLQQRAAAARLQQQQQQQAKTNKTSPSPAMFTHFANEASQQSAAALSPLRPPVPGPQPPVKLRSKPMPLTREQIILGVKLPEGIFAMS